MKNPRKWAAAAATLLTATILAGPAFAQAGAGESSDPRLAETWRLATLGDHENVLEQLESSDEPAAHVVRALAHNGLEHYDLAVQEARRAIERLPPGGMMVAEAHNQLGLGLMRPVLRDIDILPDPAGALVALAEAETAFRTAFAAGIEREGDVDGILLNLAAAMVAQFMLNERWNSWGELDEVLESIAGLLPEHAEWAEQSLREEPTLPASLASLAFREPPPSLPTGGLPEGTPIYHVGGDIGAPRMRLPRPQPQYTEAARKARIQGVVIVQAIIDERGVPVEVKILRSLDPGLDRQAMEAVSKWRFEPATLNGEPVAVYYNLTVNFRLQ